MLGGNANLTTRIGNLANVFSAIETKIAGITGVTKKIASSVIKINDRMAYRRSNEKSMATAMCVHILVKERDVLKVTIGNMSPMPIIANLYLSIVVWPGYQS